MKILFFLFGACLPFFVVGPEIAQGLWTKPVSLGPRAVGWPSNEIEALNAARISGKTDTQIRELVETLHTKRQELMAAWGL